MRSPQGSRGQRRLALDNERMLMTVADELWKTGADQRARDRRLAEQAKQDQLAAEVAHALQIREAEQAFAREAEQAAAAAAEQSQESDDEDDGILYLDSDDEAADKGLK